MVDHPEDSFDDSDKDDVERDSADEEQEPSKNVSSDAINEDDRAEQPTFAHLDWSSIVLTFDLTNLMPKLDLNAFLPKMDLGQVLMPQTNFTVHSPSVASLMPKLNISGLFSDLSATSSKLFQQLKDTQPPNWPVDVDLERVAEVVQDDGLPLVWVPRAPIVEEVLRQDDHTARTQVLVHHLEKIVADCREVLDQVVHEDLAAQVLLAQRAVEALADGHHEAAQALAVVATETVVVHILGDGRKNGQYRLVKRQAEFNPDTVAYTRVRLKAALAPLGSFFVGWFPNEGTQAPKTLSRHVSVHQADPAHYTEGHGLTAVMLAASVLRGLQDYLELEAGSE